MLWILLINGHKKAYAEMAASYNSDNITIS